MKIFGLMVLFTLLILEGKAIYFNKSDWPFHSMNMFADKSTASIYKLKIKILKKDNQEYNAGPEHLYPFGPWRFKVAALRRFKTDPSELQTYLQKFFEYSQLHRPDVYETIKGIRLYQCSNENQCILIGKGS